MYTGIKQAILKTLACHQYSMAVICDQAPEKAGLRQRPVSDASHGSVSCTPSDMIKIIQERCCRLKSCVGKIFFPME